MKNFNFFKLKWLLLPFVLLTLGVGQMWGATTVTYTFTDEYWRATADIRQRIRLSMLCGVR